MLLLLQNAQKDICKNDTTVGNEKLNSQNLFVLF